MKKKHPFSFSFRRLNALIVKEFYQIIRDPSSILIAFVLPLILLFLYGVGVSLDAKNIKLGIVMEEATPDALSFVESFLGTSYFDIKIDRHIASFEKEIVNSSIRGIVLIPSYFSAFRKQPSQLAPIQVIADGSEPNTANFLQNYVQGTWQNWLNQEKISNNLEGLSKINPLIRYWYNEELDSRNSLVPGSLAIVMTLIGTLLTALVVSREWERGTMESLMATAVTITELIVGKLVPYFILGMGSMTVSVLISVLIYQIPFRGSFLVLALVTAAFLLAALALGLLISTLAKNQLVASQAALVTGFLPAFILSGFIFEISSMPRPIQLVTNIIPARYFVTSLQTLFLTGNVWTLIIPDLLTMLLMSLILFFLISHITVKRLD